MIMEFVKNITQNVPGSQFTMFKAMCIGSDGRTRTAERVNFGSTNCLILDETRLVGQDVDAEDPRLIEVNGIVYVICIVRSWLPGQIRGIAISRVDEFRPTILTIEGQVPQRIEKNWAPFTKDGRLYFVYNYDPLVILSYDFNPTGVCTIVHADTPLPFRTETTFFRGGSNLLPYKGDVYLGFGHSRLLHTNGLFFHYTHAVFLDTHTWKVVYVSDPLTYSFPGLPRLLYFPGRNCIQDPVSYLTDGTLTVNFDDTTSLLYRISVPEPVYTTYPIGSIQRMVLNMTRLRLTQDEEEKP